MGVLAVKLLKWESTLSLDFPQGASSKFRSGMSDVLQRNLSGSVEKIYLLRVQVFLK